MRSNTILFLVILTFIFIGFGDSFLPGALGKASYQARSKINEVLVGLFPNPDLDKVEKNRLEEAEEKTEQKTD